jgi:hypothetical protein
LWPLRIDEVIPGWRGVVSCALCPVFGCIIVEALHNTKRELPMLTRTKDPQLAREAKAIVALAFRNGPIEKIHAGRPCPTCSVGPEYSRITDDEMKAIMKSAVDRVYSLLRLKSDDSDDYARQIAFGARYVTGWDEPAEPGV